MTTFNLSALGGGLVGSRNRNNARQSVIVDTIVDFTSTTQPNSGVFNFTPNATTLSGNAAGDTVNVFPVPAAVGAAVPQTNPYTLATISPTFGSPVIVSSAGIEVLIADTAGNSGTLQVTDGSQTYTSALSCTTTGFKAFTSPPNKLYTAAGSFISLAVATGAVNCIVRVWMDFRDMSAIDQVIWY